jgi:hypothetical protein
METIQKNQFFIQIFDVSATFYTSDDCQDGGLQGALAICVSVDV